MHIFKAYSDEKKLLLEQLDTIKAKISLASKYDIDCSEFTKKLNHIKENIELSYISIVLTGGFSNGKTSLLAGWFKASFDEISEIKKEESTSQIKKYEIKGLPEKCYVVDTPGLYGHKELQQNNDIIKYDDITRKYIDEANLILYIMDVKNPIKNSHIPTLQWLFKELNKFSNTIFIINKMDLVADITDESSYKSKSKIAIDDFKNRIKDILSLSNDDMATLNIVTIASNPDDKDFTQWFKHYDIYKERSHINEFNNLVNKILENTSKDKLIIDAGISSINTVLQNTIVQIENKLNNFEHNKNNLTKKYNLSKNMYNQCLKEIMDYRAHLFDKLNNYETYLINSIGSLNADNVNIFFNKEIGIDKENGGAQLLSNVTKIIRQHFDSVTMLNNTSINQAIELYYESIGEIYKCDRKDMLETSNLSITEMDKKELEESFYTGLNLFIKQFKEKIIIEPEFVNKIADSIKSFSLAVSEILGVASILLDMISAYVEEELFASKCDELNSSIKNFFKKLYEFLSDDEKYLNIVEEYTAIIKNEVDMVHNEYLNSITMFHNINNYMISLKQELEQVK